MTRAVNASTSRSSTASLPVIEPCVGRGGDPVDAVITPHGAGTNGALELLFGFLGGDDLFKGDFKQARCVVRVMRDVDVARQAVAHRARLR